MIPFPIAAILVLTPLIVIGALCARCNQGPEEVMTQPRGLLGKAYRPTIIAILVVVVIVVVFGFLR